MTTKPPRKRRKTTATNEAAAAFDTWAFPNSGRVDIQLMMERIASTVPDLNLRPEQVLAELPKMIPLAGGGLWLITAEEHGVLSEMPVADHACPHPAEIEAQARRAVEQRSPVQDQALCSRGAPHPVFAVPLLAPRGDRFRSLGALVLLGLPDTKFEQEQLLRVTLIAARLGDAINRRQLEEEATQHSALRGRLLTEVITAAENERKRIAADIHDDTLQSLGTHLMKVQIIQRLVERGALDEAQRELEALAVGIQENAVRLRAIMSQLRPSMLSDYGLLATIDDLIQKFTGETGIPVSFASRLGRRLPPDHEVMIYRIIQEALSNIRKHAAASKASIVLEGEGDWYSVQIEDNGTGFQPQEAIERSLRTGHFGLLGIRERAELIGGSLTIDSAPGKGTRLTIRLPRLS